VTKYSSILGVVIVLLATLAVSGCVRVSNPFVRTKANLDAVPADALRDVAEQIETAVRNGEREPDIDGGSLSVDNPEIKQAIRSRAARNELLQAFLDRGFAFEGQGGLVYTIRNREYKDATSRRERDRHALLVLGENENRWTIYEELARENDLGSGTVSAIQKIFAQTRIDMMTTGQKYKNEDGDTVVVP